MQSRAAVVVRKANGERELFVPQKLYTSLVRSGAEPQIADAITRKVADSLQDGEETRAIYNRAFRELRKLERSVAARYSVKHALLELGPSGYPFEDYLGEIFRVRGYLTRTRVVARGRCVEHELDLVAVRDDEHLAAEVKFHNNSGIKSDIKVALYMQARFEDLRAYVESDRESVERYTNCMIITNTKFSEQAEIYAACVGLNLVSWDYPEHGNLRELIEETRVHPISCLTSLNRTQKKHLMDRGVVLCKQVREHTGDLEAMGLPSRAIEQVLIETDSLCPASQ